MCKEEQMNEACEAIGYNTNWNHRCTTEFMCAWVKGRRSKGEIQVNQDWQVTGYIINGSKRELQRNTGEAWP